MSTRDEHLHAYLDSVVEITLPDGRNVCFTASEHPDAALPLPCFVLTAWNPGSHPRASRVNNVDQALLERELKVRGCDTMPAVGRASDGSWSERSVAVWGLTEQDALRLGGDFGQVAIFAVTQAGLQVLPCPVSSVEPDDPSLAP